MNIRRISFRLGITAALVIGSLLVSPLIGPIEISLADLFGGTLSESQRMIFYDIRLPRVLLGFLAGGSLAVSGLVFQALLRNPLATPFTLGIASGASLGSAVYMQLGAAWTLFGLGGGTWLAALTARRSRPDRRVRAGMRTCPWNLLKRNPCSRPRGGT
ncbi:MAG: iron chelate uptake ABC transporter family permease subunit [candidate division Zixibacteria bacterium]|nr:iron chelate uptake ABC transporter family permease subunit [candidate division Zixibacteria bacterium]